MTIARAELVDTDLTRWYHCVLRCVRGASLLGAGDFDRKQWIENQLEELSQKFAISIAGFSILDNQVHLLARLDTDLVESWSDEEIVMRWGRVIPPRDQKGQVFPPTQEWARGRLREGTAAATARERLASLSWFMKCLKEPLSRLANRSDGTRGTFFEGRFRTVAILDDKALLATCASIDLIPVAEGLALVPRAGSHTSIKRRIDHAAAQRSAANRKVAKRGGPRVAARGVGPEESLWLCPIERRRGANSTREGMFEGLSLDDYVLILNYTARFLRDGEAPIPRPLKEVFARLEIQPESWHTLLINLSSERVFGRFFAVSRERLREASEHLGIRRSPNLGGCPTE